jgi:bifunctional NMN adenylyltransferase/nudix hydrolase
MARGKVQMQEKRERYDVGVVIGRFQVPELHDAHTSLIQHVCEQHDKVVILLGLSPLMVTTENPLDFESRKQMILDEFPNVTVLYVRDQWSDELWSRRVDEVIEDVTTPAQTVVLYGGRDSFIGHYKGRYPSRELEQDTYVRFSGTEFRKQVASGSVRHSPDFRAGVVWAAHSTFPTVYTCVDVLVISPNTDKILLGRKKDEDKYRLFGGFTDPASESFEADARREVMEEAGISVEQLEYVNSFNVDDWRYRKERDRIRTLLYHAVIGAAERPRPGDDIYEVRWFDANLDIDRVVMENHRPLVRAALNHAGY